MIKAIETVYNGYRFRSRLEARWAVFFDTLGVKYEYEKEGYDLDGTWYLPDFYLPEYDCWIEIKGETPKCEEFSKAFFLSIKTGKRVFIFFGNIEIPTRLGRGHSSDAVFTTVTPAFLADGLTIGDAAEDGTEKTYLIPVTKVAHLFDEMHISKKVRCLDKVAEEIISKIKGTSIDIDIRFWQFPMFWTECITCKKLDVTYRGFFTRMPCRCVELQGWKDGDDDYYAFNTPRFIAAYTTARQARFEKGK